MPCGDCHKSSLGAGAGDLGPDVRKFLLQRSSTTCYFTTTGGNATKESGGGR